MLDLSMMDDDADKNDVGYSEVTEYGSAEC